MINKDPENFNSEWNYALSYLQSLRHIENLCIQASLQEDYDTWLKALKSFYRELYRVMTNTEREAAKNLIFIAEKNMNGYNGSGLLGNFKNTQKLKKVEQSLEDIDCYLKNIMRIKKMDLPSKEDPGKAMLR